MTEKKKVRLVLEKPPSSKAIFMDFKVEREEWNNYRLADETLIRAKIVALGFTMEESLDEFARKVRPGQELKLGLGFNTTVLYAVEAPFNLRGTPDSKKYPVEDLRASIIEREIDFETVRATWNSYVLDNGIRMKARLSAVSINRTSKFDSGGMPIYLIDSGVDVKINLPERIDNILRKKETKKAKTKKP